MANMLAALVCVFVVGHVTALTNEQVAKFQTTGDTESNTGLVGTVNITTEDDKHIIECNGIPDHETDTFPNPTNPHNIKAKNHHFEIPVTPTEAAEPGCLPMGPIGVLINGIPIYNPFTKAGNNAVEGEYAKVYDICDGHPNKRGSYHYHKFPSCVIARQNEVSPLIGVALDGYAIYGPVDENGNTLTPDDLDACHGRVVNGVYQYHATETYPYILGCFKGEVLPTSGLHDTTKQCFFASVTLSDDPSGNPSDPDSNTGTKPTPTCIVFSVTSIFLIISAVFN